MPKHLESQEEADTGSWKVPVPPCSPAKHPRAQALLLERWAHASLPSVLLYSPWGSRSSSLRQVTGELHRVEETKASQCEEGAATEQWAVFTWDHTQGPGVLCTAPSRKWELSWTFGHGPLLCLSLSPQCTDFSFPPVTSSAWAP